MLLLRYEVFLKKIRVLKVSFKLLALLRNDWNIKAWNESVDSFTDEFIP